MAIKDTIPSTHLNEHGWLMCPRCKNDKKFTVLVQHQILNGVPSLHHVEELAEWSDYNTVICEVCSFYLTWGGASWRPTEDEKQSPRAGLLRSLPLSVLESLLEAKKREGQGG